MRRAVAIAVTTALLALAPPVEAHLGSPDAVQDGQAGPYHLLVTIRPPEVIPGIAQIEIRALDDDVARVSVVPLPLRGPGASSPPVADVARTRPDEPRVYDSAIWLMQTGAWQIRVTAEGARGSGVMAVPIPALAQSPCRKSPMVIWCACSTWLYRRVIPITSSIPSRRSRSRR